jgi:acetylornithine deacetylase/succinyl-diaminopimelate desuccinylase-like protein
MDPAPLNVENSYARLDDQAKIDFKAGIVTSVYAGALLKRSLIPLKGDLIVCCVPRLESYDFGIKYLLEGFLKERIGKIKGVVLCEPTDLNINLGHKGKIEYEIVVKGRIRERILERRGLNALGTMSPLISELEKASHNLPTDSTFGSSSLKIKDVKYNGLNQSEGLKEFKLVIDRTFVPEENPNFILNKAKNIAEAVYKQEPEVVVATALAKSRVMTNTGFEVVSEKEFKPWKMEAYHPFVLASMESLKDNGFKASIGYWQNIVTEGSYTFGQLAIPTIGFGAGSEGNKRELAITELEKAIFGQILIAQRNIGMPTFGWSEDEI